MTIRIRAERDGDARAIFALTKAAFHEAPHADGDEAELVDRLRDSGDLALSLVAVNQDKDIIGHVAFSPVSISGAPGQWYQLAPISVMPMRQKSGIGSRLVEAGLAQLAERGAAGVALVGDPAYYSRFGFTQDHDVSLDPEMNPFLQVTLLGASAMPTGKLTLAPAFG
ncbi:N-acetyltransferase [Erythrobacteraceae bacterium WH01K]|nr:N-acetyltransferase [Erythrobacteraceae bacterium WH01K]